MVGNFNKKALLFLFIFYFLNVLQAQEVTLQFLEGSWVDNSYIEKMEKDKEAIGYDQNLQPVYKFKETLIYIVQYRSGYSNSFNIFASEIISNYNIDHIPTLQEIKNVCENDSRSMFNKNVTETSYFLFYKIMNKDGKYFRGTRDVSVPLLHMEKAPIYDGKDMKAFAKACEKYYNSTEYKKYLEQDKANAKYVYTEQPWFIYVDANTIRQGSSLTYVRVR